MGKGLKKVSDGCPNWASWKEQIEWALSSSHKSNVELFFNTLSSEFSECGILYEVEVVEMFNEMIGFGLKSGDALEMLNHNLDTPVKRYTAIGRPSVFVDKNLSSEEISKKF